MAYIGKSPTGSGVRHRYVYTATGGETSLSGADDNSKTLKFTDGEYVDVHLNGVLLVQGTDYGVGTANTISSLAALAANDVVEITVYDIYNVAKINSEAMRNRWYFTATGGETSIGTSQISNLVFPANAEIDVKLNGITLQAGTDYNTTSANTVGGLSALTAGQVVEIVYYEKFVLADTVSKASGGTFANAVTVEGTLDVTEAALTPLRIKNTNSNGAYILLGDDDSSMYIGALDGDTTFWTGSGAGGTGGSEKMRIEGSGQVGIGTTSPSSYDSRTNNLVVGDSGDSGITIFSGSSSDGRLVFATEGQTGLSNGSITYDQSSDYMAFETAGSERLQINSDGILGIGGRVVTGGSTTMSLPSTTSRIVWGTPGANAYSLGTSGGGAMKFGVSGDNEFFSIETHKSGTSHAERFLIEDDGTIHMAGIHANTTSAGANVFVASTGEMYRSTSSNRYKSEITDAAHGLTELMTLRSVTFKGNNDGDTVFGGLIAEEVHTAGLTEFVEYSQDDNGNDQPEAIYYANMVSLCIKAIQELKNELDAEKAKVATLQTQAADFESRISALETAQ